MSRIGKQPIAIPGKVDLSVDGQLITVKGGGVELNERIPELITVKREGEELLVERADDSKAARAAQGLSRTLIANMVEGVTNGFSRKLIIEGVGYRAELKGDQWVLFTLGYSHLILFRLPDGISATVEGKENSITVSGANKELVGSTAADIRRLRPPEPYKGKGVRYADEHIRRKEGKAGAK